MNFTTWLKGFFSHRKQALSLYRSGMVKANNRDYDGAIADYSAAIQVGNIPKDVKAMAIYNRALAYSAIHDDERATDDLATVLETPGLPANIKTHAEQRREWIRQRDQRRADRAEQREQQ
jgi:hypothetical protein